AVHPIHSEVVACVVGRAESLCALAVIGAIILLLGRLTTGRAVAIWLLAVISLLSKEHALILPLLLGLVVVFAGIEGERRAGLLLAMLILWTWAGYIVFRESILKFWWDRSMLDWIVQPLIRAEGADRWLLPLAILGRYALLLVWPARLSIDYGVAVIEPAVSWTEPFLYLGALAAAGWLGLTIWAFLRRRREMLLALVALALSYGLIANVLTLIGAAMGERLIYLPSVFFLILVGFWLAHGRRIGFGLALVAIALGSWRTFTYVARFDDRLAFYEYSAAVQPRSLKIRLLLASELKQRGELDRAAEVASGARELVPSASEAWLQSAVIALARNRFDEADEFFAEAIRLSPNPTKAALMSQEVEAARAAWRPATAP
ncbi:MAG: hypothetical protein RMJ35_06845, partial [Phycisphaerales bacterium]|nr:hypothetical protein [Phycisphaerales bacterium]